jgi:hypothetical protein
MWRNRKVVGSPISTYNLGLSDHESNFRSNIMIQEWREVGLVAAFVSM